MCVLLACVQKQVSGIMECADAVLKRRLRPGDLQGHPEVKGQGRGQESAVATRHSSAR